MSDVSRAAPGPYDLLVVGGGVQGAWIALEASRAGQRVALIERDDFGSGTSANSLKVLHGGLRYLQHGNLKRIRESRKSVRATRAIAGEWVEDIPFHLETRGAGVRGPWAMRAALSAYGLLCLLWPDGGGRPRGKVFSGDPALFPGGQSFSEQANGVARWNEAVMRNSERIIFEVIRAAVKEGAECRNYCEMLSLDPCEEGWAARVIDHRDDSTGRIIAKKCIEATGPAVEDRIGGRKRSLLRGVNLVFQGKPFGDQAIGLESREESTDPDALIKRGKRLLFFVPHGDQTMIGTWYDCRENKDTEIDEGEIESWLDEIRAVSGKEGFTRRNLRYIHAGFLPGDDRLGSDQQPAKESEVFQCGEGRLAVRTVKYTTAPEIAREALSKAGVKLAPRLKPSKRRAKLPPPYPWERLLYPDEDCDPSILNEAIREEKVFHLDDALLRRSNVFLDDVFSLDRLGLAAKRMADVMGWDGERQDQEVRRVQSRLFACQLSKRGKDDV